MDFKIFWWFSKQLLLPARSLSEASQKPPCNFCKTGVQAKGFLRNMKDWKSAVLWYYVQKWGTGQGCPIKSGVLHRSLGVGGALHFPWFSCTVPQFCVAKPLRTLWSLGTFAAQNWGTAHENQGKCGVPPTPIDVCSTPLLMGHPCAVPHFCMKSRVRHTCAVPWFFIDFLGRYLRFVSTELKFS